MPELYIPRATDWISALEAGEASAMTGRKRKASEMIGGAMARGDYEAAAQAAYGSGDYATGSQIEGIGAKRADAQRRKDYGAKYAAGQGADAVKSAVGAGDFEIAGELQKAIDAATSQQKAFILDKANRIAEIVAPLGEIPETDIARRKAYIVQHAEELKAAGYTQEQIDTFEPTDANLAPIYTQALGLKEYLGHQGRLRDDQRAERAQMESERHNRVGEGQSAAQLGVSRGNLGVSQGNLDLAREREKRQAAQGGGWEEF